MPSTEIRNFLFRFLEREDDIYVEDLRSVNNVKLASERLHLFCKDKSILLLVNSNDEKIQYCDGIHLNENQKA